MAKKVQPVDILPAPSSSDDETEDQDGSSSDTDDEQQPQHPPPSQKPQNQQPQESEESDDDDSDDETEDDEPLSKRQPVVKKPSLQEPQKPEESEDDDDESDGDSDDTPNSPTASGFTVKPVVSKPVSKSPEPKTPTSKPARVKSRAKRPADSEETDKASKPVSKNQEPGKVKGKRPAEVEIEKVEKVSKSKKSKVSNGEGQSGGKVEKDSKSKKGDDESGEVEEKKSIIKWSEKDEVALLGGIIEFKAETGEDVNSKVDTFYEYAKDLLSVSLTKSQLYEKIRRLKKKFQTNADKWQNGEEPVFAKPHESKLFELSQKIWGSEGTVNEGNDTKVKTSKKKEKKDGNVVSNASTPKKSETSRELFVQEEIKDTIMEDKKEETKDFWSLYPLLCATLESEASDYLTVRVGDLKDYVKRIISRMGEEKARELEDGWKDIHVMDHQLYARRALLISKQAQAMSDLF